MYREEASFLKFPSLTILRFPSCVNRFSSKMPFTIPRLVSYLYLVASTAQASPHFGDAYQLVTNCLTSNKVPFASNSSVNWDYFATDFNLRLVFEPTVITLPKTPEDVSNSVRCAAVARLQVQAKSGGHSYGSYSLGGKNGSLIIDLESFNSISVDNSKFLNMPLRFSISNPVTRD
jgi:hypothetical protein